MSDNEIRTLERLQATNPSPINQIRLWMAQYRSAPNSLGKTVDAPGTIQKDSMDIDVSFTVAYDVADGSTCSGELPIIVEHVFWEDEAYETYEYSYQWMLFVSTDGRFGTLTAGNTGTCSSCGSHVYNVTVADTLEDAIMLGFSDQAREAMGWRD